VDKTAVKISTENVPEDNTETVEDNYFEEERYWI
jgi:hypothetical protein